MAVCTSAAVLAQRRNAITCRCRREGLQPTGTGLATEQGNVKDWILTICGLVHSVVLRGGEARTATLEIEAKLSRLATSFQPPELKARDRARFPLLLAQ
jgi:hypothetical protein